MIMNKRIVLLVVLLLLGQCMWAQSTRVKGKVTDAKTGEVLPLVNVFFTGTTIGMTTDFDGEYYLETREEVTELQASFVGYLPGVQCCRFSAGTSDFRSGRGKSYSRRKSGTCDPPECQ